MFKKYTIHCRTYRCACGIVEQSMTTCRHIICAQRALMISITPETCNIHQRWTKQHALRFGGPRLESDLSTACHDDGGDNDDMGTEITEASGEPTPVQGATLAPPQASSRHGRGKRTITPVQLFSACKTMVQAYASTWTEHSMELIVLIERLEYLGAQHRSPLDAFQEQQQTRGIATTGPDITAIGSDVIAITPLVIYIYIYI